VAVDLALVLLLWLWRPLRGTVWRVPEPGAGALVALYAAGWVVALSATFTISHADLFGLRQAFRHARRAVYRPPAFTRRGLYRVVRHPLMTGFLLVFWATPTMRWAPAVRGRGPPTAFWSASGSSSVICSGTWARRTAVTSPRSPRWYRVGGPLYQQGRAGCYRRLGRGAAVAGKLPVARAGGGGNDVVAATTSSGARRCGNDVVGQVTGGGSGDKGEAGGAGGPGEVLTLTPKDTGPWPIAHITPGTLRVTS
jgi:hypothetical protein